MPIETTIDHRLCLVVQCVTRDLRSDEVIEAQRRLYAGADHDPSMPVLWDARGAAVSKTAFEEMLEMARKAEPLYERMRGGKTAILVSSTADFGMGRMYQSLTSEMPRELRVFRSYDEAIAWLTTPEIGETD